MKKFLSKNNNLIVFIIRIVLAITIVYLLVKVSKYESLIESFMKVKFRTILIVTILYFFSILISIKRWKIIIRKKTEINVSEFTLYKSYLIGSFLNNFLPTSFGGDASKVFTIKEAKNNKMFFASSILIERFSGIILNIIVCIFVGPFFIFNNNIVFNVWLSVLILFIGLIIIFSIYKNFNGALLVQKFPSKIADKLSRVIETFLSIKLTFKDYSGLLLLSLINLLVSVIGMSLYLSDLNYNNFFSVLLFVIPAVNILTLIPISFNSIGVKEFGYVGLLGLWGVIKSDSLAISLVSRVLLILYSLIGGVLLIIMKKSNKSEDDKNENNN